MFTLRKDTIVLVCILLLALALRVINNTIDFTSYWYDEAEYSVRAMHILENGGAYDPHFLRDHPPLFMYILATIFWMFGSQWLVARGFIVIIGVATTLVLYYVGRALKDEKLGLICASIFALSPLAVLVTREVVLEPLMGFFLFLMLLFLIRFEKDGKIHDGAISVIFLGLACLTKEVALVVLVPLFFYVLKTRLFRKRVFLVYVAIFLIMVLPVYIMMVASGFLGFHSVKFADVSTYTVGDQPFVSNRFVSLLTFVGWVNVGLIPVALIGGNVLKRNEWKVLRALRNLDATSLFLVVWLLASFLFSLTYTVMGPHYDYSIFLPLIPLMGLAGYRYRKLLIIVLVFFLVISLCGFLFLFRTNAVNESVDFLDGRIEDGDTIVTTEVSVMTYFFRDNEVWRLSPEEFLSGNHTFLVTDVASLEELLRNESVSAKIQTEYEEAYASPNNLFDTMLFVYERTA